MTFDKDSTHQSSCTKATAASRTIKWLIEVTVLYERLCASLDLLIFRDEDMMHFVDYNIILLVSLSLIILCTRYACMIRHQRHDLCGQTTNYFSSYICYVQPAPTRSSCQTNFCQTDSNSFQTSVASCQTHTTKIASDAHKNHSTIIHLVNWFTGKLYVFRLNGKNWSLLDAIIEKSSGWPACRGFYHN